MAVGEGIDVQMSGFWDFTGQGWLQLTELTLAFVLSALGKRSGGATGI
jgi:hypothetical protein